MSAPAASAPSEPVRIADAIEDALALVLSHLRDDRREQVMVILKAEGGATNG